jgi:hypothetical protein
MNAMPCETYDNWRYIPSMKRLGVIAAFLMVASSAPVSHAQTSARAPENGDSETAKQSEQASASSQGGRYYYMEQQMHWYGWQPMLIDAPALTGVYFATRDAKWGLCGLAGGVYVLGGPAIHLMHQRPSYAVLSGISRLTLPMAMMVAAPIVDGKPQDAAVQDRQYAASLLVGGLLASALDELILSNDTIEVERRFDANNGPILSPLLAATGNSFTIGVQGVAW